MLAGLLLHRPVAESIFVSVCIALSSTTVVMNSLPPAEQELMHGKALLAVLLMQDVYLGGIVAVISLVGELGEITVYDGILLTFQLGASLALVALVATVATKYGLGRLVYEINSRDAGVTVLGLLSICFAMMKFTEMLGVSSELGCFVAGMMINISQNQGSQRRTNVNSGEVVHRLISLILPIRDVFLAIFLASVGVHLSVASHCPGTGCVHFPSKRLAWIDTRLLSQCFCGRIDPPQSRLLFGCDRYPTFLLSNFQLLCSLTMAVTLMK